MFKYIIVLKKKTPIYFLRFEGKHATPPIPSNLCFFLLISSYNQQSPYLINCPAQVRTQIFLSILAENYFLKFSQLVLYIYNLDNLLSSVSKKGNSYTIQLNLLFFQISNHKHISKKNLPNNLFF